MNNTEKSPDQRPLSPHLQIYRPTISMVMSVMHRLTGLSLYFGVSFLIIWFVALILGPESYEKFNLLLSMQFVQIIFFLVTWAFFHHLFGGIRHFIWDFGLGFGLKSVDVLSYMTLVLSLLTTILIFLLT
jgi:succinate dehydrogenase / fumarate reductase cytochrome b subunit|tara:strand:- start:340 stop:729 length:390 start_codon:yes stop_codon:yes gene_type:complete